MSDFYKTDLNFDKTASGDIDTISGVENVKKRLYRRLITSKATLINRNTYGVGIKNYLNTINNLTTQRKLFLEIVEQFEKDESVSKVLGVSISKGTDSSEYLFINVSLELVGKIEQNFQFSTQGL